jgi:peptidyl-prolyl cis-trans isomerase B (cyclophilin B)
VSKAAKRERQRQNRMARKEYEDALDKRRRFWKSARTFGLLLIPIVALFVFFALRNSGGDDTSSSSNDKTTSTTIPEKQTFTTAPPLTIDPAKNYLATVDTNQGSFQMALDPKVAPQTVNSFVFLANQGFYDGLPFHRIVKDFVIQGGDPEGTGSGGSGSSVVGEVPTDHYPVGSLAAAKTGSDPAGTFDSQFFIVTGSQGATLPNDYARFGSVVSGIEAAQAIEALAPASGDGPPTAPATIDSVQIDPATCGAAPTPTSTG